MSEVQLVLWRDIPAQVKARQGRERAAGALSPRFQEAIDAAAMRAGLYGTDDYLGEWRASAWEDVDGSPQAAVELRRSKIEEDYDSARLRRLVEQGGREA